MHNLSGVIKDTRFKVAGAVLHIHDLSEGRGRIAWGYGHTLYKSHLRPLVSRDNGQFKVKSSPCQSSQVYGCYLSDRFSRSISTSCMKAFGPLWLARLTSVRGSLELEGGVMAHLRESDFSPGPGNGDRWSRVCPSRVEKCDRTDHNKFQTCRYDPTSAKKGPWGCFLTT